MRSWLALCALAFATSASAAIPPSQRDALIAFYNATGGPSWTDKTNWLGAQGTECTWFGVGCDDNGTNVTQLELYTNNLRGTIPPEIGNLPALQVFISYENPLTGAIPAQIGQLSNLELFEIINNGVSGPIPQSIGSLAKLQRIYVDGNALTGPLPHELGNLGALQELSLSYNAIDGALPRELGQLSNLTLLEMSVNKLSGPIPKELGALSKLTHLGLTDNQLTGNIPAELGQLAALKELRADLNQLDGSIPPQLGALRKLEILDLGRNSLSGEVPKELGDLAAVTGLYLNDNKLTGNFPPDLLRLTAVEELNVSGNQFKGELPKGITALRGTLTRVWFDANQFTGSIPAELGQLSKLTSLTMPNNQLSGTIPVALQNLSELTWFDAASNQLTGHIPPELGKLSKLTVLSLYSNRLDGPIPPEIGNLSELTILYLDDNKLTGSLPDSLGRLKKLESLTAGNELTGPIGSWIGELSSLGDLRIGYNHFTGVIPSQIGQLAKLNYLDLGNNELTGHIPPEIGNLHNLQYLTLESNQLDGPIPPGFWQLTGLVDVRLSYNSLSGTLPPEVGSLRNVEALLLGINDLEGVIPPEIGNLTNVQYLSLTGNRFSGAIPRQIGNLKSLVEMGLSQNALHGAVPPEVKNLTSIPDGHLDLNWNALFTNDPTVRDFLNRKDSGGDWASTQTVTPANLRVTQTTDRSATLEWDLIPYIFDEGGYQVVASTGGVQAAIATTDSKEITSIVVRGLAALTPYTFTVSAITHPHDFQNNLLVSDPSAPVASTTTARVIAPADVVVTEPTSGLVQVDGVPRNEDSFTLTNFGDTATTITISKDPTYDWFTFQPDTFSLPGGASRTITIRSLSKPAATYYGYLLASGDGTGDGIVIPVVLLSVTRPAGTVSAQPLISQIELAGAPGSDSVGVARFRNTGTAPLSGIVIADQPWVEPRPDPITIDPGTVGVVNFTVRRAKRPVELGTLTANLSLVYVAGSSASAAALVGRASAQLEPLDDGVVSVSKVTVVDVSRPPLAAGLAPPTLPGEVALFTPGVAAAQRFGGSVGTDVSILNAGGSRAVGDLRLFFSTAGTSSTSTVATMPSVGAAQSISLVNVVSNVYSAPDAVGTLQVRSSDWRNLAVAAKLTNAKASGTLTGDVPVFRSDRSAGAGQQIFLAGVRRPADIYVQETSGVRGDVRVDYLDASGAAVGTALTTSVGPFGLIEQRDAVPPGAVTAIVTSGSTGRLAAYARVSDPDSGDTWSVVDWSRVNKFALTEAMRIPLAEGRGEAAPARRRSVKHSGTALDVTPPRSNTDVTLFNPLPADDARVKMQVIDASGSLSEREITVPGSRTMTVTDAGAAAASPTAQVVIVPLHGQVIATARTWRITTGTIGAAIPVLAAASGLRVGQSQTFADLHDSTAATVRAATPATFRTSYGFVETAGQPATVRATVVINESRSLVAARAVISRDFQLAARQQLFFDELVRSVAGASRDTDFSDLHGLQLRIEVTGGNGAVVPFVVVTDNGTGDSFMRVE